MWINCPVTLKHGDCIDLMKDIPDGSIDMILCDLPYGTTDCKWDSVIPFEPLWMQYKRIAKVNGAIVLFSAQPFTTKLIYSNLKNFKYCWYWKKNNATGFCFAKYQPMRNIEDICVFYRKMPTYNPQGLKRIENPKVLKKNIKGDSIYKADTLSKEFKSLFTNYPKNVLEFANEATSNRNRFHPTQKPVALLEYLVKTYTNLGDTVLDNCMGSGSTGVACMNTGRNFIGMELNEKYFDIAKRRIEKAVQLGG